ncbi:lycopene beta-cyclase [Fulvimarina manganoxydans]|uniref:Lycopene beta-cyclase n=1 Tax=Fulvimarina manganoxydans TaxID=937218 RepID=A0A1W2EFT0_9HYPH|nr:lycopene beta-cyclase CrtY [Fulvimarina manganoxydans]SMD08569.1 lycopene beta-cyclase [Fulvimarina manganoxydans]
MSKTTDRPVDIALIGGGLANGLVAWRLAELRPELSFVLLEAGPELGGNHTWSFHGEDLTPDELRWFAPFVTYRWDRNLVRFPNRHRRLSSAYLSVSSERFRALLNERFGDRVQTSSSVEAVEREGEETRLVLQDGAQIRARAALDGRGYRPGPHLSLGFQKFLGQEIELAAPHGVAEPTIMDATVPQDDGYRFVYVLPLTPTRLLIEDTYYADAAALDRDGSRAKIDLYRRDHGWLEGDLVREEEGVLPIALSGDIDAFWADREGLPASGLSAALFHPTTGYSLPDAVHLADRIATLPDHSNAALFDATRRQSIDAWADRGFFRMLNRLLYLAGDPAERYRILEHFYRLPEPVVSRFYAARLTRGDKLRILTGKPPVSVRSALRVLASRHPQGAYA